MADTLEHLLFEGSTYGSDIVAVIDYSIEEASGDGWNEPRVEAHASIWKVSLVKVSRRPQWRINGAGYETITTREDLGPAPDWVRDVLEQQEWRDAVSWPEPDEDNWRDEVA